MDDINQIHPLMEADERGDGGPASCPGRRPYEDEEIERENDEDRPMGGSPGLRRSIRSDIEVRGHLIHAIYEERNQVAADKLKEEVKRRLTGWNEGWRTVHDSGASTFTMKHKSKSALLSPSLIAISGPPLTGKTHLARAALRETVEESLGGYFVTGRWWNSEPQGGGSSASLPSFSSATAPYRAFASALEEFAGLVLKRGPEEISRIRRAVSRSVGVEAFVLTRFLPSLRDILESQGESGGGVDGLRHPGGLIASDGGVMSASPSAALSFPDADLRFTYVFGSFFRAISSIECPLVLMMDDIHNSDPSSLSMLATILTNLGNSPGFLVVVAVRPDEIVRVGSAGLTATLRPVEPLDVLGSDVTQFNLKYLDEQELCDSLRRYLEAEEQEVQLLSRFLYRWTSGNPLYMIELLMYLVDRDLVTQDSESGKWSWDIQEIDMSVDGSLSLEGILACRLRNLSDHCQEALGVASCLGGEFDSTLLDYALGRTAKSDVQEAVSKGLLCLERGRSIVPQFRFENTYIQRAAYSLLPVPNRLALHLDVGRRIWKRLDEDSSDNYLFIVMSQFRIGQSLIQRPAERQAVASLCYQAGVRAARTSSFHVASEYFNLGIELLGANCWRENYDLALSLRNAASEMCMCSGDFEAMDAHITAILANARVFGDSIQARATKIYSYGMSDARQSDAVQEGIEVLRHLGIALPSKASELRLRAELATVQRSLKSKTDNFFLRMPTLTNPEKRSCLQILSLVYQNSLWAKPDLLPFVILRMISITIDHGMSEFASVAFTNFGMLCIRRLGDVDMGYRFGSLGLAILDRFKANELVPRVYATFYKHIYVHKKPINGTLQPLAKAYRIGLYTGDLEAAFLCAIYFCMNAFDAGIQLPIIEREYSDIIRRMEASRQKSMLTIALPLLRWKRDLMGLSSDPLAPDGDLVNYDTLARASAASGRLLVVSVIMTCRLIVAHVLNEYEFAEALLGSLVDEYMDIIPEGSSKAGVMMTSGMCSLELARLGRNRSRNVRTARAMVKRLRVYAKRCPCNYLDKYYLMQAELASYRNDSGKANQKYLASIALADAARSRYVCAKANEAMARHLHRRGEKDADARDESRAYFVAALRAYEDWGASVKVERLIAETRCLFPGLEARPRPASRPSLLRAVEGSSTDVFTARPRLSLLRASGDSSWQDDYAASD
jgi:predicted ATPase